MVELFFTNSMAGFNSLWRDITTKRTKNVQDFLIQNICIHFTGDVYKV